MHVIGSKLKLLVLYCMSQWHLKEIFGHIYNLFCINVKCESSSKDLCYKENNAMIEVSDYLEGKISNKAVRVVSQYLKKIVILLCMLCA